MSDTKVKIDLKEEKDTAARKYAIDDFTTKTWREDFCFIVENKRLYVAKNLLALVSPVFERMFQAEFKEQEEPIMELPGKKFEYVQEFLRCMYPSMMKKVTILNAQQIVLLAEEFQVADLKSKCETCLVGSVGKKTSAKVLYGLLNLAWLHSLDKLFYMCTRLAAEKSPKELNEAEKQTPIPLKIKVDIQQEIIDNLKAKQVETEEIVDHLNTELKRVMVLYNYHRAGIPQNERLSLNGFQGWSGETVSTKIDTRRNTGKHVCMIGEWGIKLDFRFINGYFQLVIGVPREFVKGSIINLVGKVVIVNGLTSKKDFCKTINIELCGFTPASEVSIMREDTALGDEGYNYHSEINVDVHLLLLKTDKE